MRTTRWTLPGTLLATLLLCATASTRADAQTCYGPGDITADAAVTLADVSAFATLMAGPGVQPPGADPAFDRADLQGDSDVDLADFALLVPYFKETYFDYGPHRDDEEAEMLTMALTGQLRAPETEYQRIVRDLELIRTTYVDLVTVIDDPDYVPNQLVIKLVAGEPLDDYHDLNATYMVTAEDHLFGDWWTLTFCDNLNATVLAAYYTALPAVQYADPNYLIGTDDQIDISILAGQTYRYNIDDGFLDCFDGCDCHRVWVLDVDSLGVVTLVSYDEWGMSWCDFSK